MQDYTVHPLRNKGPRLSLEYARRDRRVFCLKWLTKFEKRGVLRVIENLLLDTANKGPRVESAGAQVHTRYMHTNITHLCHDDRSCRVGGDSVTSRVLIEG